MYDKILDKVAEKATYTKIENYLIDGIIPYLNKNQIVVLLHIYRYSIGFHRTEYKTNAKKIAESTHLRCDQIIGIVESLAKKKLFEYQKVGRQLTIKVDRKMIKYEVLKEN